MNTEDFWGMFGKMAYEAECRNCPVLKYKQDNFWGYVVILAPTRYDVFINRLWRTRNDSKTTHNSSTRA
jgi:hypothetical protein